MTIRGSLSDSASAEHPFYAKVQERREHINPFTGERTLSATKLFMVTVDEGWRQSTVCNGMYEWAADWLVEQLQGKPYAKSGNEVSGERQ